MRRMIPVLAAATALAFVTTACGQNPARVDGAAAPLTSAVPFATASTPAGAAPSAPSSPPGKPAKTGNTDNGDALLLTASGLGKLKLGMSVADAEATGLIGEYHAPDAAGGDCGWATLKAGGNAEVGFNKNYGLYTIGVRGKSGPAGNDFSNTAPLRTPAGIKLGSRLDTVKKAYSGYADIDMNAVNASGVEDHTTGRAGAKLSGSIAYRFSFYRGTLYTLSVINNTYRCGE